MDGMNSGTLLTSPGPLSLLQVPFQYVISQLPDAAIATIDVLQGPETTQNLLAVIQPDTEHGAVRVPMFVEDVSGPAVRGIPMIPDLPAAAFSFREEFSRDIMQNANQLVHLQGRQIVLKDGPTGWKMDFESIRLMFRNTTNGAEIGIIAEEGGSNITAGWNGTSAQAIQKTIVIGDGPDVTTEYFLNFGSTKSLAVMLGMDGASDVDVSLALATLIYRSVQYAGGELGGLYMWAGNYKRQMKNTAAGFVMPKIDLGEQTQFGIRSNRMEEDEKDPEMRKWVNSLLMIRVRRNDDRTDSAIDIWLNRRKDSIGAWPLVESLRVALWDKAVELVKKEFALKARMARRSRR